MARSLTPFAAGAGVRGGWPRWRRPRSSAPAGRGAVFSGYGLTVVAILLFLTVFVTMGARADQWALLGALCVLGAGVGLMVGAALRHTEVGAGLFGLSLCFPAVLGGHLIVGPLQVAKVGAVTRAGGGATEALAALTDGVPALARRGRSPSRCSWPPRPPG